jgi:hypothetical protein
MTSLTLAVDQQILYQARLKALAEHTSVNALVRDFIVEYVRGADHEQEAKNRILALSQSSSCTSGPEGRTWTRDSLHDRTIS